MQVSRDSFARTELHKLKWRTDRTCRWCGQNKRDKRRGVAMGAPFLFVFRDARVYGSCDLYVDDADSVHQS